MKLLSVFPLLLGAGIAISQVSATPLHVVVVTENISHSNGFIRVGHSSNSGDTNLATVQMSMKPKSKHGCKGLLRNKAKQLSDWFRITFGMPDHQNEKAILPSNGVVELYPEPIRVAHLRPHPMNLQSAPHRQFEHPHTFVQRLTHALMMLGPWEGRAIAFILGCGIGVLIRMIWVFGVLAIRSIRGKKQQDEFIEDEVLFEEEHLLAPPQYIEEAVVSVEKEGHRDA